MPTSKSGFSIRLKDGKPVVSGFATRQQIADWYGISGKTFARTLKQYKLDFGTNKLLTPNQIVTIVECWGMTDKGDERS